MLREYVYLRGEPVALLEYETQPGWYFYVTDHLGTPQQLVDSRGAVVWQAAYLPYGEAKVLKATVQNNLRFPGQYFDAETGLHYNWNRYYNPKTGRYITADPIGLAGGMNLYAYVSGNPVNAVDVEGLTAEVISAPILINISPVITPVTTVSSILLAPFTIISIVFYPTELAVGTIPSEILNNYNYHDIEGSECDSDDILFMSKTSKKQKKKWQLIYRAMSNFIHRESQMKVVMIMQSVLLNLNLERMTIEQ